MAKGFFNYLVFRLSTLNLTVLYATTAFSISPRCGANEKNFELPAIQRFNPHGHFIPLQISVEVENKQLE
jgi:hypothetical protein